MKRKLFIGVTLFLLVAALSVFIYFFFFTLHPCWVPWVRCDPVREVGQHR